MMMALVGTFTAILASELDAISFEFHPPFPRARHPHR